MSLFSRKGATPVTTQETPPALPPGERIYAVGDIHGRSDLLDALAARIEAELAAAQQPRARTVFLGDYVDRGMRSRAVVERLANRDWPTPLVALRGNHEAVMLDFLKDPRVLEDWRHYGAYETLASYGVDVKDVRRGHGYEQAQATLLLNMPESHIEFLQGAPSSWSLGDYFFCHAGVRPGVPLARQTERDLLWIRHDFLHSEEAYEKIVVHGHTPVDQPESRANRINVDTGAYATGTLTCVVLEGEARRFLST